ncbi:MAG: hypothetical protein RIQ79_817 [Verrucomicrobiota bacterium]|jgi:GPH family glycoside/pentoside/hexuronide:cation symporter
MRNPAPKPYSAPPRQVWAWGTGGIANHILICTYGQATAIFTIGFSLDASLVAWAIMLPRLIDGVTDPILGHLSDNTHTRWGRRKPFLVLGSLLAAVSLVALWWADREWSSFAQLAYLFVFGTLFYCAWGLYSMSWNAIGYELTDDYHERSRISAIGSLFLAVVLLGNSWTYWFALRPFFGNEINGIRWIAGGVAIIAVVSALVATLVCKERFTHANTKKHKVAMLPALRTTIKNHAFRSLMLIKICQTLGERAAGGILFFVGIYFVCQGDKSLATKITGIGGVVGTVWSFASVPLIKPISRWLGKKGGLILGASGSLAAALITPFAYSPEHPYWMLFPAIMVVTLLSISNTIANAIMPDICDVDEVESGQRREGLFTAVMGFVQKIEISLCALLVGYLVVWSGLDTKVANQPDWVLHRLFWLAVVPNIIFTAGYFFLALRFPLTEKAMIEVREKLDQRHRAETTDNDAKASATVAV